MNTLRSTLALAALALAALLAGTANRSVAAPPTVAQADATVTTVQWLVIGDQFPPPPTFDAFRVLYCGWATTCLGGSAPTMPFVSWLYLHGIENPGEIALMLMWEQVAKSVAPYDTD